MKGRITGSSYKIMNTKNNIEGTLQDKYLMLLSELDNVDDIRVNVGVFDRNMKCLYIQKCVDLIALFRYMSWHGYRTSIDRVIFKIKHSVVEGRDVLDSIKLADDFNLNLSLLINHVEEEFIEDDFDEHVFVQKTK